MRWGGVVDGRYAGNLCSPPMWYLAFFCFGGIGRLDSVVGRQGGEIDISSVISCLCLLGRWFDDDIDDDITVLWVQVTGTSSLVGDNVLRADGGRDSTAHCTCYTDTNTNKYAEFSLVHKRENNDMTCCTENYSVLFVVLTI